MITLRKDGARLAAALAAAALFGCARGEQASPSSPVEATSRAGSVRGAVTRVPSANRLRTLLLLKRTD